MSYQSNLPAIKSKIQRAEDAGLIAAADLGIERTKARLENGYYTGGEYATGNLLQHIHRTEPFTDASGNRTILYGVDNEAMYALFWELGFYKLPSFFSHRLGRWVTHVASPTQRARWYRVEIWLPVFLESQGDFRQAYLTAAQAVMKGP